LTDEDTEGNLGIQKFINDKFQKYMGFS